MTLIRNRLFVNSEESLQKRKFRKNKTNTELHKSDKVIDDQKVPIMMKKGGRKQESERITISG